MPPYAILVITTFTLVKVAPKPALLKVRLVVLFTAQQEGFTWMSLENAKLRTSVVEAEETLAVAPGTKAPLFNMETIIVPAVAPVIAPVPLNVMK